MRSTIAQSSQPVSNVPAPPTAATEWTILIAALAWLGRQAWTLFATKEKDEATLTAGLIDDLRKERSDLINNAKSGFRDVTAAISELKKSLNDGQCEIDRDFQEMKRDQAGEYAGLMITIGKLQQSIDALHVRFDDFVDRKRDHRSRNDEA